MTRPRNRYVPTKHFGRYKYDRSRTKTRLSYYRNADEALAAAQYHLRNAKPIVQGNVAWTKAKFAGRCGLCGTDFDIGATICRYEHRWRHWRCP